MLTLTRRQLLQAGALAALAGPVHAARADEPKPQGRIPVIDVTDLYHPPQDPGDNFDLIAAYALPELDLKAVILDVTQRYRRPFHNPDSPMYDDPAGGRDPGFIPVTQLNHLFGRNVPCAAAPFEPMRAPDDPMRDAPGFQQAGIDLMLETLRTSAEPVHVVSFGSARPVAVAYNREPSLLREKVGCVHLCAGAYPPGYVEWNVQLDPHAFVRLLRSDLPVAIYPCATEKGAFDLGAHNTYWQLPDRGFVRRMDPRLRAYLAFAFGRTVRADFLNALEEDPPEAAMQAALGGPHHVWETAVWAQVSGRRLVRRADGAHRLLPRDESSPGHAVIHEELLAGRVQVADDGQFSFEPDSAGAFRLYHRQDPQACQAALCEALPALYESFVLPSSAGAGVPREQPGPSASAMPATAYPVAAGALPIPSGLSAFTGLFRRMWPHVPKLA